jgi:hypothetical protein
MCDYGQSNNGGGYAGRKESITKVRIVGSSPCHIFLCGVGISNKVSS